MKESINNPTQEKSSAFDRIIDELLKGLKPRPKEILIRRFGLESKIPQVLDKIGRDFGITRERVRQIERDSFKRLRSLKKSEEFEKLIDKAVVVCGEYGGFCDRVFLKKKLVSPLAPKEKNQLMFILNSTEKLSYNKGSLAINGFWFLPQAVEESQVEQAHSFIVRMLKEKREPFTFEEIYQLILESPWKRFFSDEIGKKRLQMVLILSRELEKNILGEWGIKNWRLISQRGTREKSFLVLRKYLKPLHFIEITDFINEHWPQKKALPQTVHNELIKDKRFILVGRGIYGLRDWGYDEGTVKEIIIKLLKEKGVSVHRDEIVQHVLTKKKVKKTTVMVNLADRATFNKDETGRFVLKTIG